MKKYLHRPDKIWRHEQDLPDWLMESSEVKEATYASVDTEAMGLNTGRDRLCVVQISFDSKTCHVIKFAANMPYISPNLCKILENTNLVKIFHFARFDICLLFQTFGIITQNIYCTKIASKLARTYTERHGLKMICKELLGVEISKNEQSSDWGKATLSEEQALYAAMDVLYLDHLREKLNEMLTRECREEFALACFNFLPHLAQMDCLGWSESIFAHL